MTPRPLTVEFLLLALADASGKPLVDSIKLKAAVAGAAIVDLTFDGALRLTERGDPEFKPGRLVRTGRLVTDGRLAEVAELSHNRKPRDAVGRIGGMNAWRDRAGGLKDAVLEDLVAEGVLTHEQGKVLGLFPTNAWPLARPEVEREILDRVRATVVAGAEPDARTSALVALLYSVDLLPKLFPDQPKREVQARGCRQRRLGCRRGAQGRPGRPDRHHRGDRGNQRGRLERERLRPGPQRRRPPDAVCIRRPS